jgi:hypothetical protein
VKASLTTLAVVIGSAAIVLVVAIGSSGESYIVSLIEGVGSQLVHLLGGEEQHLATAGRRLGTAGQQRTAQSHQADFGQRRGAHEGILYLEVALFSGMPSSGASRQP